MNTQLFIVGIFLLVLLAFSGFFSGSETAFFSLNHLEKDKLRRRYRGRLRGFIVDSLNAPEKILVTLLTGNMLVNLLFASLMDRLVARFFDTQAWLISILAGTVLVLIFGEMTPKNIAIRHSLPFFGAAAGPLYGIHLILKPVRVVVQKVEGGIVSFMSGRMGKSRPDVRQVLTSALRVAHRKGIIHVSELSIVDSFMEFREKTADEVMTPRTELVGLDARTRIRDVLRRLPECPEIGLVPVYEEDLDHLVGYLHLKDLLPYRFDVNGGETPVSPAAAVRRIMRAVHPVPEKKNVLELFREMRREGREMALVVDEYGGTAGIITVQSMVENVLEFFYPTHMNGLVKLSETAYRLAGHYDLDDLEELLQREFDTESRTVAGLIIERLGEIPPRGASVTVSGIAFVVCRVAHNRVLEVEARVVS